MIISIEKSRRGLREGNLKKFEIEIGDVNFSLAFEEGNMSFVYGIFVRILAKV